MVMFAALKARPPALRSAVLMTMGLCVGLGLLLLGVKCLRVLLDLQLCVAAHDGGGR